MAKLIWTSQALDDVEAICKFIAYDAPTYAEEHCCFIAGSDIIPDFPDEPHKANGLLRGEVVQTK